MYGLIDYGSMLRDRRRIDAYTRALASVVGPTSVVLDLGAGLGTFGILACRMGAARVYAVEPADIISVAKETARANHVDDRMTFIQARAADLELPEQVDVIVSDLGGALPLFEEHIVAVMSARDRFLRPGGVLVPQRDRLLCAPVSSAELYGRIIDPWHSVAGLDLGPAAAMALHATHALPVEPLHLAAEPRCWATLDYMTITSPHVRASLEWRFDAPAVVHGIALWFECTLQGDVTYASGPWSSESVHSTMVLPLLEPLAVRAGEHLGLRIETTLAAGRYVVTWQAGTERQPGGRQSTFAAEPRSTESLTARQGVPAVEGGIVEQKSGATFRVPERVLFRSVGDEVLLLDLHAGTYHVLNATGGRVWELMAAGHDVESIVDAIAAQYDVDAARAADDVRTIVLQLQQANLIQAATE